MTSEGARLGIVGVVCVAVGVYVGRRLEHESPPPSHEAAEAQSLGDTGADEQGAPTASRALERAELAAIVRNEVRGSLASAQAEPAVPEAPPTLRTEAQEVARQQATDILDRARHDRVWTDVSRDRMRALRDQLSSEDDEALFAAIAHAINMGEPRREHAR